MQLLCQVRVNEIVTQLCWVESGVVVYATVTYVVVYTRLYACKTNNNILCLCVAYRLHSDAGKVRHVG